MAHRSLSDLAEKMRDIDFAMLSTKDAAGRIRARPMSNNREVDFDGDSFFFTYAGAETVRDIAADPHVGLGYQARSGLLGQRPFFAAIEGRATLIRDRPRFAAHWHKELDRWFPDGIETPEMVLIQVHADHAHYWDEADEGEVALHGRVHA